MPPSSPPTPPPDHEKLPVATELIKARERAGLTQAQLAAQSTVSLSAIKAYETGRNYPGGRELRLLCMALQVTPTRILFGVESPFEAEEGAIAANGIQGQLVYAERVRFLLAMLTADERRSVFTLLQGLAAARHGEATAVETTEAADLFAFVQLVKQAVPIDPATRDRLLRSVLRNPEKARELAAELERAAAQAEEPTSGNAVGPR